MSGPCQLVLHVSDLAFPISLWKQPNGHFTLQYGLELKSDIGPLFVGASVGRVIDHALQCQGLLDCEDYAHES